MKSLNRCILLLAGVLMLVNVASAQERQFHESVLTEKGRVAFRRLLEANRFALFGVGYGGETSEGERALDILVEETEAIQAFKQVIKQGTSEGGIYALVGLKMLNCKCLSEQILVLKNSPEPLAKGKPSDPFERIEKGNIRIQSGCIVSQQKRSKILEAIEKDNSQIVALKVSNFRLSKNQSQN